MVPTIAATRPQQNGNDSSLFKRLASTHLQSYATALAVTIAVGCFLLLLNVFIFAAIYYQREKRINTKHKEELSETDIIDTSSPSIERYSHKLNGSRKASVQSLEASSTNIDLGSFNEFCNFEEKLRGEKHAFVEMCTVKPVQEFKCSAHSGINNSSETLVIYPTYSFQSNNTTTSTNITSQPHAFDGIDIENVRCSSTSGAGLVVEQCHQSTQSDEVLISQLAPRTSIVSGQNDINPENSSPKGSNYAGILRNQAVSTPSASKKRVQIQEISV